MNVDRLLLAGRVQSGLCASMGSPTWAAVIDGQLSAIESGRSTAAIELLAADRDDPLTSNVWLRLLGAAHRLVLDGVDDELRDVLPTAGGAADPPAAAARFDGFVARHGDAVSAGLGEPVQTNEVMRSAPIAAALNWLGGEISLLEVGASAGLNLWPDRYRIAAAGGALGPADATLTLRPDVVSGRFPSGGFRVTRRLGCDRRPLDPTHAEHRRLLRSFVWPDHVERLRRLDLALDACPAATVEHGDAVEWTRHRLADPAPGQAVLFHTIVMPYLPSDARREFDAVVRAAGARADGTHRLAWLRMELALDAGDVDDVDLLVTQWPAGTTHRLARLTPHATAIRWDPLLVDTP